MSLILVADAAPGFAALQEALGRRPGLTRVDDLPTACRALEQPCALVVCGCHFDEGRMYDLLRHMKSNEALAGIPFVAIRTLPDELDDALYESVQIAVTVLGGQEFVDLPRWRRQHGDAEAARRLAALVQRYVGPA